MRIPLVGGVRNAPSRDGLLLKDKVVPVWWSETGSVLGEWPRLGAAGDAMVAAMADAVCDAMTGTMARVVGLGAVHTATAAWIRAT